MPSKGLTTIFSSASKKALISFNEEVTNVFGVRDGKSEIDTFSLKFLNAEG